MESEKTCKQCGYKSENAYEFIRFTSGTICSDCFHEIGKRYITTHKQNDNVNTLKNTDIDMLIGQMKRDKREKISLPTVGNIFMRNVRRLSEKGGGEVRMSCTGAGLAVADYVEKKITEENIKNITIKRY